MTDHQFDTLTKLMRARSDSASNLAARAVLVEGATPTEAAEALGASRMQVANAVRRYRQAHELVLEAYPGTADPLSPTPTTAGAAAAKARGAIKGRRR